MRMRASTSAPSESPSWVAITPGGPAEPLAEPKEQPNTWGGVWEELQRLLLERIGHGAFRGCASLTSLALPASLTSLGEYVFHGCSSLTEITVPASLTTIGYVAPDARPVPLSLPPAPPSSTRRRLRWLRA